MFDDISLSFGKVSSAELKTLQLWLSTMYFKWICLLKAYLSGKILRNNEPVCKTPTQHFFFLYHIVPIGLSTDMLWHHSNI